MHKTYYETFNLLLFIYMRRKLENKIIRLFLILLERPGKAEVQHDLFLATLMGCFLHFPSLELGNPAQADINLLQPSIIIRIHSDKTHSLPILYDDDDST